MKFRFFYKVILFVFLISSESFGQNVECSDNLKEHVQTQLLIALDSLVGQIILNTVNVNLLLKEESEFTKGIYEEVHIEIESFQDSLNILSTSLLNSYPIGSDRYLNQIAFFVQKDNEPRSIQMILKLVAHLSDGNITFSTPLRYYTETWKEKTIGSITYHYRNELNNSRAELCDTKNTIIASRFNLEPYQFKFFMAENYQEILRLIGIDYNAKSIGQLRDGYGPIEGEVIFSIMNNEDFSHDIFHYYVEAVHAWSGRDWIKGERNWVVEEGLAYSWGNAYYTKKDGEIAEQEELLGLLREYLNQNKETDLLKLFENNFWSDKSEIFDPIAPDLQVGRLMSSIICDEVYRVHGMEGINTLLLIGSSPDHFDPFFEVTKNLLGISRINFNERFTGLINKE